MVQRHKIEDTIDRVYDLIKKKDDASLEQAYEQLCNELNEIGEDTTPEIIHLHFQAMAAIIRCQLYVGTSDDFVEDELQMLHMLDVIQRQNLLDSAQLRHVAKLTKQVVIECNDFYAAHGIDMPTFGLDKQPESIPDQPIPRPEMPAHDCFLCRSKLADCKDSHMAPHFLVQPFLSTNGSRQRGKEVVTESMLGGLKQEHKWGRSVLPDEIDATFGPIDEADKETLKPDALARDDFFCNDCEKRFSYIESAYADYLAGRKKNLSPEVGYLFWLGVIWRLSLAGMCIKLTDEDSEKIRQILDRNMPDNKNGIDALQADDSWGDMGYVVLRAKETKSELLSLSGNHAVATPYKILCGPYIIIMYTDLKCAGHKYPISTRQRMEPVVEMEFMDWWKERYMILQSAEKQSFGNMSADGHEALIDVAKGDRSAIPGWLGGQAVSSKDIGTRQMYELSVPGALMRAMEYKEAHPFLSPQEIVEGIEKQYGYTQAELQEIADFWEEHHSMMRMRSVQNTQRHKARKKRAKQTQRANKKRRKR